ncbi:MAG: hypothetical protein AAFV01_11520, partial [Bacteroidota bacterium]
MTTRACFRHTTLFLLGCLLAVATVPESSAQFDRLRDRARKAAEEVQRDSDDEGATEAERPSRREQYLESRGLEDTEEVATPEPTGLAPLVYDRPFDPAIHTARLLDYVEFEADGRFALTDFTAVFV